MKKFMVSIVAMALLFANITVANAASGTINNFVKNLVYDEDHFQDVTQNNWYYESVKTVFEYGLMNGPGDGTFNAKGEITLGEALALVSRIHSIYYTGEENFTQGNPWYQVYVDYAFENGIIFSSFNGLEVFFDYEAPINRFDFVAYLYRALPSSEYEIINDVQDDIIPDVPTSMFSSECVYTFYRAGILTGSGENRQFNPYDTISRSEVAAIVTRVIDPNLRQSFTLSRDDGEYVKTTGMGLSDHYKYLNVGESFSLFYTLLPESATNKTITWTSSNPSVASVQMVQSYTSSGSLSITAVGNGSAVISGTSADGTVGECVVTVYKEENNVETPTSGYFFAMNDSEITQAINDGQNSFASVYQMLTSKYGVSLDHINLTDDFWNSYYYKLAQNTSVSVVTPAYYITRLSALRYMDFEVLSLTDAKWYYETLFENNKYINIEIKAAETSYDDNASFSVGIMQNGNTISVASVSGLKNELPELSSNWPNTPAYYRNVYISVSQSNIDVTKPIELIIRYVTGNELVYSIDLGDYKG